MIPYFQFTGISKDERQHLQTKIEFLKGRYDSNKVLSLLSWFVIVLSLV